MKALRQLGFLKLSLRPESPAEEDHRVLALFRNRAELKKAYGDLQEEIYRLQDLVKQQEADSSAIVLVLVDRFLGQKRRRFTMAQVAWRRSDQFRNFVAVLEFGAIDFDYCAGISDHRFGERLDESRFTRSRWTQKQKVADRAAGSVHSGQKSLINIYDLVNGIILSNDPLVQISIELFCLASALNRIQPFIRAHHGITLPPASW